jgi:hypothetical protein
MIDSFVTIDSNRGGGVYEIYPCKLDPFQRWNGFAVPRFSARVFSQILEDFGYELVTANENHGIIRDEPGHEHHVTWELRDNATYWYFDGWCWSWINDKQENANRYEINVRIRDRQFRRLERVYEYELPALDGAKIGREERFALVTGITRAAALRLVSELKLDGNITQRGYNSKQRNYELEVGTEHRICLRFRAAK